MAANKVPTLDEMLEYCKRVRADRSEFIADVAHNAMMRGMSKRIFAVDMPEDVRETAWKFCKQLAKYTHAPVSAADYKKMEKWSNDQGRSIIALIDVLLKACDGYYPGDYRPLEFDIIGFYYSIALLSQSQYRRTDCLALLDKITAHYVNTNEDRGVLLRNMQRLVKDYPDLLQFKTTLEKV